jgi:hypothetical protein
MNTKIKAGKVTKGMTIVIDATTYTSDFSLESSSTFLVAPKKNKKTQSITILDTKVVASFNTGNGRTLTKEVIEFNTIELGLVYCTSTRNFIIAN